MLIRNFATILTRSILDLGEKEILAEIEALRALRVVDISKSPKKKKAKPLITVDGKQIKFGRSGRGPGRQPREKLTKDILIDMAKDLNLDELAKLDKILNRRVARKPRKKKDVNSTPSV